MHCLYLFLSISLTLSLSARLRDKYRTSIGERRGLPTSTSQVPVGLLPTAMPRSNLTPEQVMRLQMTRTAYFINCADFNSLPFCTTTYCNGLKYDNSVIKQMYQEQVGLQPQPAYGWIKRLFIHELYPGGPNDIMIDVEWLDVLPMKGPTGLTLVRKNSDNAFNQACRFTFLKHCQPHNVALLSQEPEDPTCITFSVVDRSDRCM